MCKTTMKAITVTSTDGAATFLIEIDYRSHADTRCFATTCPLIGLEKYLSSLIQASILFRILSGV